MSFTYRSMFRSGFFSKIRLNSRRVTSESGTVQHFLSGIHSLPGILLIFSTIIRSYCVWTCIFRPLISNVTGGVITVDSQGDVHQLSPGRLPKVSIHCFRWNSRRSPHLPNRRDRFMRKPVRSYRTSILVRLVCDTQACPRIVWPVPRK